MKVLHLIGGGDVGGAKTGVLSLLKGLSKEIDAKLISFRKGSFADDAASMGIDVEVVHSGNVFSDIRGIISLIRKEGFDVIHSHGAKGNMIGLIAKICTGLPLVTTMHSDYRLDYMHSTLKRLTFGFINTLALRFVDYYIGVSTNIYNLLKGKSFTKGRAYSLPNGIDFNPPQPSGRQAFSDKYNIGLSSDEIVVGILARLTPIKGLDTFLEAAKTILETNPKIKFIIGGEGEERERLELKAKALGIAGEVSFPGYVDSLDFMSAIDINVLTSVSEGFPYSILEGAVSAKATVSSDVGGISDLIENDVNGYLFKPGDVKKLASLIIRLADDTELRKTFGKRIYDKAKEKYSVERMIEIQLSLYRTIVKETGFKYARLKKRAKFEHDAIITGYYGFRNIGDDAILKAMVRDLRMLKPEIKLLVLSSSPTETAELYGVDSIKRKRLFQVLTAMKHSKILIHGGGTLLQDNTSTRSLFYYLGTIWLAARLGLKTMLYANGVGPIRRRLNRVICRIVINKVEVITLREEASRQELIDLLIFHPKVVVTADPALNTDEANPAEIAKIFAKENIPDGTYIGFSIRYSTNKSFEETVAKAADYAADKHDAKILFIPLQYPNDLEACSRVMSKMKRPSYVIGNKYGATSEDYIAGIIGRTHVLCGMRLHSLIFATSQGVPVIGLSYDSKIESFLSYIGQPGFNAGAIGNISLEKLKYLIDEAWDKRDEIKNEILKAAEGQRSKAFENAKIAIGLLENGSVENA